MGSGEFCMACGRYRVFPAENGPGWQCSVCLATYDEEYAPEEVREEMTSRQIVSWQASPPSDRRHGVKRGESESTDWFRATVRPDPEMPGSWVQIDVDLSDGRHLVTQAQSWDSEEICRAARELVATTLDYSIEEVSVTWQEERA
jgi:hypothetical protein